MAQDIIGPSKSQQKVIFLQRRVLEHGNFNEDESKMSVYRTSGDFQKVQEHLKMLKIEQDRSCASLTFLKRCMKRNT